MKVLGVLGGMGPEATVAFLAKVVKKTPARKDQDHIHIVMDMDPSVPDRTEAILSGRRDEVVEVLCRMARRLVELGAEVLAIPCNTAHAFLEDLRREVPVRVLDMVEEVVRAVPEVGRVGLLATTGTVRSGLYRKAFFEVGMETLEPSPSHQEALMGAVRAVKAGRHEEALGPLEEAARELRDAGAEVLVVGCTELSLLLSRWEPPLPCVDSLDVLAEASVREALGGSS